MAMINDMAQLWRLPPSLTPKSTPANFEEAQVCFMEVFSLSPIIVAPSFIDFLFNFYLLDFRVQLNVCLPCALSPLNVCLRQSYTLSMSAQGITKRN